MDFVGCWNSYRLPQRLPWREEMGNARIVDQLVLDRAVLESRPGSNWTPFDPNVKVESGVLK